MTTAQSWLITGTLDGAPLGEFDTKSGGEPSAEVAKHRPGGMRPEKSYPAMPTFGDLTIGRELDRERDIELYRRLLKRVGAAQGSVSAQPLDDTGAPWGKPFTYTVRLNGMSDPEADGASSEVSMYTLTFTVTDRA